jgi:uncharacterized protein with HEPN domain
MPPDDRTRIFHIADLDTDEMLLFALVRAVEIIGEAASKVSSETRDAAPNVPWTKLSAMRNRLIHAYFHIDRDILWRTVVEEVPALPMLLSHLSDR